MKRTKWFFTGMIAMLLIAVLAGTAVATTANIPKKLVYRDIKVSLDGDVLDLKDAAGGHVEPFMFDGTNYLPVRALAEALGLSVSWDSAANTIILSSEKTVAFYADCPNVPDFGAYAGIPCAGETTEGTTKLYIYNIADITKATADTENLFLGYVQLLVNEGFTPYDMNDGTGDIYFVDTHGSRPVMLLMGPIGVDGYCIAISQTAESDPDLTHTPTPSGDILASDITIYVIRGEKRYHLDSKCGNKTYTQSTLDQALLLGWSPCPKCGYRELIPSTQK